MDSPRGGRLAEVKMRKNWEDGVDTAQMARGWQQRPIEAGCWTKAGQPWISLAFDVQGTWVNVGSRSEVGACGVHLYLPEVHVVTLLWS